MLDTYDQVLDSIGSGMCLCISKDHVEARMKEGIGFLHFTNPSPRQDIPVYLGLAISMANGKELTKLTKDRNYSRLGWSEIGIDGNLYDIYVCTQ